MDEKTPVVNKEIASININVDFTNNRKTKKTMRRLGSEGVLALIDLWLWTAQHRPDGMLGKMSGNEIEDVARWKGSKGLMFKTFIELQWLHERNGDVFIHGWNDHQDVKELTRIANGWPPNRRITDISSGAWRRIRSAVFKRDGNICQYCGAFVEKPECDHIFPLSRGGKSTLENLATACPRCNRLKGARTPEEWEI